MVSNGATVTCAGCEQRAAKVYHYQPFVCGAAPETSRCDVSDAGRPVEGFDSQPDDFEGEGYDREEYLYHRTLLQLFDPTDRVSRTDGRTKLDRINEYTRLGIPKWDDPKIGGKRGGKDWATDSAGWRAGELGSVFIGVRPLGQITEASTIHLPLYRSRGEGSAVESLRLEGRSGSIIVLATKDEYPDLDAFVSSLQQRYVRFDPSGANGYPVAEVDATGPDGSLHRMKLAYRPKTETPPDYALEQRSLDGVEQGIADFVRAGPLWGDLIDWNDATKTLGFAGERWDLDAAAEAIPELPRGCP